MNAITLLMLMAFTAVVQAQNVSSILYVPTINGVPVPGVAGSDSLAQCESANIDRTTATAQYVCDRVQTVTVAPPQPGATWTQCAVERGTCSGSGVVRYGAGAAWVQRTVVGSIQCSNAAFGADPAPGVAKTCQITSDTTPVGCTAPQPSAIVEQVACPVGMTGSWTRTTSWVVAPAPTCWVAGQPTPAAAPAGVCVGEATPLPSGPLAPTRTTGPAPLAVLFDVTGTVRTGLDTFRQVTYAFNFGDERGQTWAVSGQPKNIQTGGPLSAHVFDVPGTYVVKVRATTATGAYSDASVTVTVQNPDTFYATTKTLCISPSGNYTGCPSDAARQTGLPSGGAWSGKRVLLHRGESFGAISIQDGNSGVQVGAYGTGAKPQVASVGVGTARPNSAAFATDITVMDLNVQNGMAQNLGSRVLFYRNDVRAFGGAGHNMMTFGEPWWWATKDTARIVAQSAFHNAREIFFVENNALGADTVNAGMGVYGSGSRVALLGNTYGRYRQHSVRLPALHKSVVAHNEIRGISSDGIRVALKLHSGGLNPYADGLLTGWASNQVVIANNLFGNAADNNVWTVDIAPQNNEYAEGIENVLVENNRFVRGSRTSRDLDTGGRNITTRGNSVLGGAALSTGHGHDGGLPSAWQGPYYAQ